MRLDLREQFKSLVRRVFHLEQAVARVRKFRGLIAEEDHAHIVPDHSERILVHSPDGSIRVYSGPDGGAHDLALEVVPPPPLDFCEASFCTVVGNDLSTYTAADCCETLAFESECLNIVVGAGTVSIDPVCGWFSEIVTGDGTITAEDCCSSVSIVGTGCVNVAVVGGQIQVGLLCGNTYLQQWFINGSEQIIPGEDCGCGCLDFVDSEAICFQATGGVGDCGTGVKAYPQFEATQLLALPEPSAIYKIKLCDGNYLYVQGYIGA